MLEGARIVEEQEAERTAAPREARHQRRQVLGPLLPHEASSDDLDRTRRRLDHRLLVDEQLGAGVLERGFDDVRRLVVVVAQASEYFAGELAQGLETTAQELRIVMRLHREEVPSEQDEVGLLVHGLLADA